MMYDNCHFLLTDLFEEFATFGNSFVEYFHFEHQNIITACAILQCVAESNNEHEWNEKKNKYLKLATIANL